MKKYKVYHSIVDNSIKKEIEDADWCPDLFQYATVKNGIDGLIAAGFLLCPEIIVVKGYIFIKAFWGHDDEDESMIAIENLEKQYNYNKKNIEMSVNTWSIGDLFVGETNTMMDNEKILYQFGEILVYFWKSRLNELFPTKKINVELGNELMGEYGLCITVFEN